LNIGIDVDSGERPFAEMVRGALASLALDPDISLTLIGNENRILESFPHIIKDNDKRVKIVGTADFIRMDEKPTDVRKRRDCTVVIGCRMLKNKTIDAFFSPGNTGATVVAACLYLGYLPGIKRPAMAASFPRKDGGETMMLDVGANPEVSEESLLQNAKLGVAYHSVISSSLAEPRIGLLNMGTEADKGTTYIKKAYSYLNKQAAIGKVIFNGNVEPYNILDGSTDIVVCDGLLGNTMLKFAESMIKYLMGVLSGSVSDKHKGFGEKVMTSAMSVFHLWSKVKERIKGKVTPKYFGAAPLLGVDGTVLIGHGMCNAKDVTNAIELALLLHQRKYIEAMTAFMKLK
jgi:glycerol-3-phosphate acyltransferase PlsX